MRSFGKEFSGIDEHRRVMDSLAGAHHPSRTERFLGLVVTALEIPVKVMQEGREASEELAVFRAIESEQPTELTERQAQIAAKYGESVVCKDPFKR